MTESPSYGPSAVDDEVTQDVHGFVWNVHLIHDLSAHADAIWEALAPGGSYYAVMGVHAGSPLTADSHRAHAVGHSDRAGSAPGAAAPDFLRRGAFIE